MAGTIQPIAALTTEDRGPINTIVSIFLPVTSALIAIIRMAMRKQKLFQFELDDIVFGIGLCLGISTSTLSHFCVKAGLGRHQDMLDQDQVVHYSKLFWITQITGVVAQAFAKSSLAVLFMRITPRQMRPQTVRLLMPRIAVCTLISLSLIAFQCDLPRPWMLSPSRCPTHGNVYYLITAINMLTDALLAICMFPIIRSLNTEAHIKSVLMCLFGSRLLVCMVDAGRMIVIHKALQSENQTRSQLWWAVMDQIVVHFSINHATLPRIKAFLSHLQAGPISMHVPVVQTQRSLFSAGRSATIHKHQARQPKAVQPDGSRRNGSETGRPSYQTWRTLCTSLWGRLGKTPSISEQPLKDQREPGTELSTTVYAGGSGLDQSDQECNRSAAASLSSEGSNSGVNNTRLWGVIVRSDIEVRYDKA